MWFAKADVAARLEQFGRAGFVPTAAQAGEFTARASAGAHAGADGIYAVSGDTAEITVSGVLTEQPDFWAWLLGIGNTAYSDIRSAFAMAAADPAVKRVSLRVASPGGHVDGLFDTLAAIQAFGKPVAVIASQACSAAYALAATAGTIQATGPAAEFGSIGVAASFSFDAYEQIVDVTSSAAPNKRPDPRTADGRAVIVEYLDSVHELFADAIATGRGTTISAVNAGFGRGSSMLASAAKSKGLIDSIAVAGSGHGASASRAIASVEDLGDQVADRIEAMFGKPKKASEPSRAALPTHSRPVGPIDPVSGLRPGQDLGDAVCERLFGDYR